MNSRFLRIHPMNDFHDYAENEYSDNGIAIFPNPEIRPSYHFCDVLSKMTIQA